jgi:hypothetical protein
VLKPREDLAHDLNHELMLGGNPLLDALIDLSQRGRHNVELTLARLWFFALGSHTPPAIKRILGLLRRDTELSIEAISALGHCHLAQLIARRGGSGSDNSLTSSAHSRDPCPAFRPEAMNRALTKVSTA